MIDSDEEFLQHFGVMGMHWGVRKDRPTFTKQEKRENRAQKYEKRATDYQNSIDVLNAKKQTWYNSRGIKKNIKDLTELKNRAVADAERKRQGKLSSGQRKVAIGTAVVGAYIGTKVIVNAAQSGDFSRLAAKGKAFVQGKQAVDFAKKPVLADKYLNAESIHKLVVKDINPEFGALGTKMNCRRSTFAYELRRRGYDVSATRTTNAYGQNAFGMVNALDPKQKGATGGYGAIFRLVNEGISESSGGKHVATPLADMMKNFSGGGRNKIEVSEDSAKNIDSIIKTLSTQPDRSRGELGVQWLMGGGHSMAYEIIQGKPVIFDGQTGEKFEDLADLAGHGLGQIVAASFTRLDNVELNKDYLLRWVQNAK